jgi:hypothetical protein|tara:strand:- start:1761 stop:2390 length:630 start_codon:yes stop_codon:yes gene_type:complete
MTKLAALKKKAMQNPEIKAEYDKLAKEFDMSNKTESHVMIDIETLDTRPTAVVLSIGAVPFDPHEGTVDEKKGFEIFPSIQDQLDIGRTVSENTLRFWIANQNIGIKSWYSQVPNGLKGAQDNFRQWCKDVPPPGELCPWSNGAAFDIPILEDWMNYENIPWKFWAVMDCRTMQWAHPVPKVGATDHTALADAIAQAKRVCASYSTKED